MTADYIRLQKEGKLHGKLTAVYKVRRLRDALRSSLLTMKKDNWKTPLHTLSLGTAYSNDVLAFCREQNRRLRRWQNPKPTTDLHIKTPRVHTQQAGRYSSRNHWAVKDHYPKVRSCVKITPKRLLWFIGEGSGILHALRGWEFGYDMLNGTYVVQTRRNSTNKYRVYLNATVILQQRSPATAHLSDGSFWAYVTHVVREREAHYKYRREIDRIYKTVVSAQVTVYFGGQLCRIVMRRQARLVVNYP